jgi:PAS domain S-box-containing protein
MPSDNGDDVTVLLVDDDRHLLHTLSDILRLRGYQPTTASTGRDALEVASREHPVVALVDLRLPDMDGMELITRFRTGVKPTEVVILTGNATVESAVTALRQQSVDYLIKPVRPDELFRTLERAGERAQRRRAEAALRESELQLRRIFEAVNDGLVITDGAGRIVESNPAAARIIGVGADALRGRPITDLLLSGHDSSAAPAEGVAREYRIRRPSGEARQVEAQVTAFAPNRLAYTIRDVTEQRLMQQRLGMIQKMDALGRLAGGVAHDFNNLLTAIAGYAGLARDRCTEPSVASEIEEISRATERAAALTRQLLAFSRRQVLQPRVLDLHAVLSDLEGMLRRLIREDIGLDLKSAPPSARVRADATQLEQVIVNLVINARDAMPEGGTVSIETGTMTVDAATARRMSPDARTGEFAYIRVSDSGEGIPPEVLPHVFEPFFTTKEPGQGTGLGLSTVHGIVQQLGGFVTVEPRTLGGTTFVIYLPQESAPVEPAEPPPPAQEPTGGTERIVVAEDDPVIRALIVRQLARKGYRVRAAENASEVFRLLSSGERYDLLLTDLVLPGMSGWSIARQATRMQPELKVLYMSGYAEDSVGGGAVVSPGVAFISKPFRPEELAARIRGILDGKESAAAG